MRSFAPPWNSSLAITRPSSAARAAGAEARATGKASCCATARAEAAINQLPPPGGNGPPLNRAAVASSNFSELRRRCHSTQFQRRAVRSARLLDSGFHLQRGKALAVGQPMHSAHRHLPSGDRHVFTRARGIRRPNPRGITAGRGAGHRRKAGRTARMFAKFTVTERKVDHRRPPCGSPAESLAVRSNAANQRTQRADAYARARRSRPGAVEDENGAPASPRLRHKWRAVGQGFVSREGAKARSSGSLVRRGGLGAESMRTSRPDSTRGNRISPLRNLTVLTVNRVRPELRDERSGGRGIEDGQRPNAANAASLRVRARVRARRGKGQRVRQRRGGGRDSASASLRHNWRAVGQGLVSREGAKGRSGELLYSASALARLAMLGGRVRDEQAVLRR